MVSGDTCLIVKNWTFLPARAIGGGAGGVSPLVAATFGFRRDCIGRSQREQKRVDRGRGASTPLGMHGFHPSAGERSSRLLAGILYRCPSRPLAHRSGWTIPILILPSSILHSC